MEVKFNKKKIFLIDNKFIKKIFNKKFEKYRICLHQNEQSNTQENIVFTKGFNYFRTHRHPRKVWESYNVIKGRLNVYLLNNEGKLIKKIYLQKNSNNSKLPFYYKLSESIFHLVLPISKETVWQEVTSGQYSKPGFVKFHKNAPLKEDTLRKKIDYCSKISGINILKKFRIG